MSAAGVNRRTFLLAASAATVAFPTRGVLERTIADLPAMSADARMRLKWILVGKQPVPCDLMTWARWFSEHFDERFVARTNFADGYISTVFLGIDHNFAVGDAVPILFETMAFCHGSEDDMERYATWDEAIAGHRRMVRAYQQRGFVVTDHNEASPSV